ncbi:hypothetical protein AAG906_005507 [Vitis piasezkii]
MHDLVEEMGREIVRHKHPEEPGKWSRLWDPKDISLVLRKKMVWIKCINLLVEDLEFIKFSDSPEIPHFSNMSNLEQLNVEGCSSLDNVDSSINGIAIEELPSLICHLTSLQLLSILKCENLMSLPSSICRLKYLEGLNLFDCSNLKTFPKIMEDMECLRSLDLSGMCIKELPSSIEFLKHLVDLRLVKCENLRSLPSSICRLKYLEELNLCDCSNLETFLKIMEDMEGLKSLDLSGTCIKELPSSIEFLKHLLMKCENLRSLPSSICRLKYLEELNLDMECLNLLNLSGTCIKELPSSIEFLKHLVDLRLMECENLRSLPSSICRLKYLEELNLFDCSNLETFPKIMEDMKCLRSLDLSGTCIKELPSSIEFLKHLVHLSLVKCENLRSLPSSICSLETFLEIMEDMECLNLLNLSGTCIKELPSSIEFLKHLADLQLVQCENLRSLPSSICRLKYLEELNLFDCSNLETFPKIMEDMESLHELNLSWTCIKSSDMESLHELNLSWTCIKELPSSIGYLNHLIHLHLSHYLSQNNMRHIPTAITQLCNLRLLNISHCKMLEEIPELPSSLREINAHDCPIFGTLSNPSTLLWYFLLKWFKKIEPPLKWRSINLRGNGIPRSVLHQKMGSQIRIELPMNWYEDDHFLGFGFFCLHHQSKKISLSLKFDEGEYAYDGARIFCSDCHEINGSESDQVLLVYYPKISFRDDCGVHLIYSQDDQQNHISSLDFLGTQDGEDSHMPISTTKAIKRSRDDAEHNQAEEPHHKRSREPNTHLKL